MSIKPRDDFFVTLPSNVPGHPENTPSNYTTTLPTPLELAGSWEVALLETHYFKDWINFHETDFAAIIGKNDIDPPFNSDFVEQLSNNEFYHGFTPYDVSKFDRYSPKGKEIWALSRDPFYTMLLDFVGATGKRWGEFIMPWKMWNEYYQKISDFGDAIANQLDFKLTSSYSQSTGKFTFKCENNRLFFAVRDPYLLNILGYNATKKAWGGNIFYIARMDREGDRKASLDELQTIYVYSDIVDYQIVGHTVATLMGVFPTKGAFMEPQSWQFNPLQYVGLQSNNIPTIRMKLCTPQGDPVQFLSGDSLCRLHFRRKLL